MLRIMLADDHRAVRRGLRSLIESHPQFQVIGEVENGREAIEQAERLRPEVVVLDITMPERNGLQASREILRRSPYTDIVLLTLHRSDELMEEAKRIGAHAVVFKPEADPTLLSAIEMLDRPQVHLCGSIVQSRHVGAFFRSPEDRYRVLGPFVAEGLAAGEKAFHIINPPDRDAHLNGLKEAGVDVERALSLGQIELAAWESTTLRDGRFDGQAILNFIQRVLRDASEQGFPLTRFVAMALEPKPGVNDLMEFESRLNDILPKFADVVICVYDVTKFEGERIIDAIRSHPAVVIEESLRENPDYVPTDQMIDELRKR